MIETRIPTIDVVNILSSAAGLPDIEIVAQICCRCGLPKRLKKGKHAEPPKLTKFDERRRRRCSQGAQERVAKRQTRMPFHPGDTNVKPKTTRNGVAPEILLETKLMQAAHKPWLPMFKKACRRLKGDTHHCRIEPWLFLVVYHHTARPWLGNIHNYIHELSFLIVSPYSVVLQEFYVMWSDRRFRHDLT